MADEDNMLLDNGDQVFLWLGSRSSEVEVKLTYKAAQVFTDKEINYSLLNFDSLLFDSGLHATFTGSTASETKTAISNSKIQRD